MRQLASQVSRRIAAKYQASAPPMNVSQNRVRRFSFDVAYI